MNILITGAGGFVGTNLLFEFKSQPLHYLIAVGLAAPPKNSFDEFYSWSELDKIDRSKIDVIIHLAGKAHDTGNTAEAKVYFDINVGLTQKIIDLFIDSQATKFIFFSSVKAVADTVEGDILTEAATCNPKTPYGQSKLEAEKYILGHPMPTGKKIYILRPCMIHGPGNKGNLNLLYRLVQKGFPWPLGAFENSRSFISIQNLQFVMGQLIDGDIATGIYHVADDESLSTNELIHLMATSLNRKTRIWNTSPELVKLLAATGDLLRLPLNSERLKKLTESYIVSNKKLKNAMSIEKMPVTAKQGLEKTFESFIYPESS